MISLLKVSENSLKPVDRSSLVSEAQLQGWIADNPKIIGLDVMVVGTEVQTIFGGRIDILAMNGEGDLIVIELKKKRTPRDIVAQVLDYASWISGLNTKQVHDLVHEKLGKQLNDVFFKKFEQALPETLNSNHSMVIVASEFDAASKRIVEYLAENHGISINTVFFSVFEHAGETLLATDWLMDQQEVVERSGDRKKAPWTGYWYANVGEDQNRSWEDMRRYGFLAAGGGSFYSKRLSQLSIGDPVFAYQKGQGYIGYGTVTQESNPVIHFEVNGTPLLDLDLKEPNLAHDKDNPELSEYIIGVKWNKTFPMSEAKTFVGVFANQNIVCKLRDPATLEFLMQSFDVRDEKIAK